MRQPRGASLKFKTGKPLGDEGHLQNYIKGKYVRGNLLKTKKTSGKKNPLYPSLYGSD